MNQVDFIAYIGERHSITKTEAKKVIDMFTSSVISASSEKKSISLIGFGNFYIHAIPARKGYNPKTGKPVLYQLIIKYVSKLGKK